MVGGGGLARAPRDGGSVLIVGESTHPAVRAMVRADLAGYIERELADRSDAGLVPAVKLAHRRRRRRGASSSTTTTGRGSSCSGPTEVGPEVGRAAAHAARRRARLTRRVKHAAAIRSARKERGLLSITVDPETLEDR